MGLGFSRVLMLNSTIVFLKSYTFWGLNFTTSMIDTEMIIINVSLNVDYVAKSNQLIFKMDERFLGNLWYPKNSRGSCHVKSFIL